MRRGVSDSLSTHQVFLIDTLGDFHIWRPNNKYPKFADKHYSARAQDGPQEMERTKQQPSMLPVSAVPGCYLVSFHILWAILSTSTVHLSNGIHCTEKCIVLTIWRMAVCLVADPGAKR